MRASERRAAARQPSGALARRQYGSLVSSAGSRRSDAPERGSTRVALARFRQSYSAGVDELRTNRQVENAAIEHVLRIEAAEGRRAADS